MEGEMPLSIFCAVDFRTCSSGTDVSAAQNLLPNCTIPPPLRPKQQVFQYAALHPHVELSGRPYKLHSWVESPFYCLLKSCAPSGKLRQLYRMVGHSF